jgi:membrane-bound metal-dependent hydrolase YbcI (DUF457 family)
MAGFRTHISTSTMLGIGYAAGAHFLLDTPLESCALAGGLCSISGMLPDLDSDSGVPLRESVAFAAAAIPVMMVRRFERLGMPLETMILAGMAIYLIVRFGLASLLKRYTVHRGMFHSLPAALIAAELAFLIFDRENLWLRYYTAGGVLLGFLSHLVLDELWSIDVRRGRLRLKKSFGTAIKIWGDSLWANISTYAKMILLTYLVSQDPQWMAQFDQPGPRSEELADVAQPPDLPTNELTSRGDSDVRELGTPAPVYYEPSHIGSAIQPPRR